VHVERDQRRRCERQPGLAPVVARSLTVCVALLGMSGCKESTRETADRPVRFSYQDRVADAVSIIAVQRALFAAEGLTVQAQRFASGPACSETLYTGAADVGTMGDTTAVIAVARNAPVRIVASHGGGENRHRIIVARTSGITSVRGLAGKRVAVKKGTSTYGGLLAYLKAHGVDPGRVSIIDMRPTDMPESLAAGSVDALVASEPTPSLAETRGGRQLATLGGLDNTYPILLVMRREFCESRPDDAVRFLRAMARAVTFIHEQPDSARDLLGKATGLPVDVAGKAMGHHTYGLTLGRDVTSSLARTAEFLVSQGVTEAALDLSRSLDGTLLARATVGDHRSTE